MQEQTRERRSGERRVIVDRRKEPRFGMLTERRKGRERRQH